MSACLILQTKNKCFIGSDTALSSIEKDSIIRVGEVNKKIFRKNNYIYFCSGEYSIVKKTLSYINNLASFELISLSNFLKKINIKNKENIFNIELVFINILNKKIYQISEYNNFDISIYEPPEEGIFILTAGFKTNEIYNIAKEQILNKKTVDIIYEDTFKKVSCQQIGGKIMVYDVDYPDDLFLEKKVDDIIINKPKNFHLIVSETIVGNLILGESLVVSNEKETFKADATGVTIKNSDFKIYGETFLNTLGENVRYGLIMNSDNLIFGKSDENGNIYAINLIMSKSGNVEMTCPLNIRVEGTLGGWTIKPTGFVSSKNSNFFMKSISDSFGENKDILFKLGEDFSIDKYGTVRGKQNFQANSITSKMLADGCITDAKIIPGTIPQSAVNGGSTSMIPVFKSPLLSTSFIPNTISGSALKNLSITSAKMQSTTITDSALLPDGVINSSLIENGSIENSDFANGAFTSSKFSFTGGSIPEAKYNYGTAYFTGSINVYTSSTSYWIFNKYGYYQG